MTDGFQPTSPPTQERPKRGPKPGTKRGPRKNAATETEVIDTLDLYARMCATIASLPMKHRRSLMQALNERFPA